MATVKELYKDQLKATVSLEKRLAKLKNYGGECHCEDVEDIHVQVFQGHFTEYFHLCVKCGGVVVDSEIL